MTILHLGIIELDLACVKSKAVKPKKVEPVVVEKPKVPEREVIIKTEIQWKEKPRSPLTAWIMVICVLLALIIIVCCCLLVKVGRDKRRELALIRA
jgi:hypothetical protein